MLSGRSTADSEGKHLQCAALGAGPLAAERVRDEQHRFRATGSTAIFLLDSLGEGALPS